MPSGEVASRRPVTGGKSLLQHAEDVVLAQDEPFFAVDLDLGPAVLAEEHTIADLDVELPDASILQDLAVADGDHFALDRLLLGGVRNDDAALRLLFLLHTLDDDAVVKRTNAGHMFSPWSVGIVGVTPTAPGLPWHQVAARHLLGLRPPKTARARARGDYWHSQEVSANRAT